MFRLGVKVDSRGFDKAFAEYKKVCKRAPGEIVTKKVYFVSRNAVNTTPAAGKEKIQSDLLKPSVLNPKAPLAAILVNVKRKGQGKAGLNGQKMINAVERFIKARQSTTNWLRSGWLAAVKAMERFIPNKSGAPKMEKVRIKGAPKGGASVRGLSTFFSSATIWNSVFGNRKAGSPEKVAKKIEKGLQEAINLEIKSMNQYIEKHMKPIHDKFNKS